MGELGVTVGPAGRGEVAALAEVLARAFADDPPFVWMLPDRSSRQRRVRRFFVTTLRHEVLVRGVAEAARDGDRVVGAALWLPPGKWLQPAGPPLRAVAGYVRAFGRRLRQGAAFQQAAVDVHPREPHWYLLAIGVDPQMQGRGAGGALLRSGLSRADATGMPAYLESSKPANDALYRHFGFEPRGTLALPADAPPVTVMWRPAGPTTTGHADRPPAGPPGS